ncbi:MULTISPECIES: ABC transporter ATP-binding protein [unclassified Janthinobacterium]|uniref:ABC transporter ATP-binding protein n=1 Tax=unclassified Janthinobacterium TaxID=2610881 RepID=UPI0016124DDA|nr:MULTISPECIES: ABC transporter ATP-binding protein [unclassified Janthinobacterium]MBB5607799.1 ABC-2 type transport system ATP-binding protein [Janthinobacterium sp. S3T4]MBB5613052.1 ABC-2 type transport system ATP-binding protein [Janthinobacterium sp. S3M3]
MLEAIGLRKCYGQHTALDRLDLRVAPGEIFCLLGANGAGKTTTINLFLNFIAPSAGSALINGLDVSRNPLRTKQDVAYIPEQVNLYPTLSGLENLRYFSALALGHELTRARLLGLMEEVGLDPAVADRRVAGYSKGMRQKVWIAVALAKEAKALLLDEPTSGLDPHAANEFSNLLIRASANGVAVLTTTHDLFHARHTGTRIGIMKQGKLVENFASAEISDRELQTVYLRHMETSL